MLTNVSQSYSCVLLPHHSEVIPINPWDELIHPLDLTLPTLHAQNDTLEEAKPVEERRVYTMGPAFLTFGNFAHFYLNFQAS
jgi:DNA-binding IclR family transcriptional regulator